MTEGHPEEDINKHADNGKPQENVVLERNADTRMIQMEEETHQMNQETHKNQAKGKEKEKAKVQWVEYTQ